ncbi:unnamed protein product [Alternaria alternata]|jgi:hypothetical protein
MSGFQDITDDNAMSNLNDMPAEPRRNRWGEDIKRERSRSPEAPRRNRWGNDRGFRDGYPNDRRRNFSGCDDERDRSRDRSRDRRCNLKYRTRDHRRDSPLARDSRCYRRSSSSADSRGGRNSSRNGDGDRWYRPRDEDGDRRDSPRDDSRDWKDRATDFKRVPGSRYNKDNDLHWYPDKGDFSHPTKMPSQNPHDDRPRNPKRTKSCRSESSEHRHMRFEHKHECRENEREALLSGRLSKASTYGCALSFALTRLSYMIHILIVMLSRSPASWCWTQLGKESGSDSRKVREEDKETTQEI